MMMDYISLAGFILAVFVAGVAVGKFVEKIEGLTRNPKDKGNYSEQPEALAAEGVRK